MTSDLITGDVYGQEREKPRAYLLAEAEKPFSALKPALESARTNLRAQLEGISEAQSRFEPSSGEGEDAWGIHGVMSHLAGSGLRLSQRIRALALGEELTLPAPASTKDERSFAELRAAIEESYRAILGATDEVAGKERLDTTWNHPAFGELNCRAIFAMIALHEADHARQIARIKALPGYPKA